jgi:predicted nucleic acid-binding protein
VTERVIVDAGPLVAFFDPGEDVHEWVVETFRHVRMPLLTCEAVLAETSYLLRYSPRAQDKILEWIGNGTLALEFDLAEDSAAVRRLMKKYRDQPMSLADACVVRMAETFDDHVVCTLDDDFRVYRRDGGAAIRLLIPGKA